MTNPEQQSFAFISLIYNPSSEQKIICKRGKFGEKNSVRFIEYAGTASGIAMFDFLQKLNIKKT